MSDKTPIVIAGLGNPGARYENTRHNLGFWVVDRLAQRHGLSVTKSKFNALFGQGRVAGQAVILVKPQTFMNLSGEAIQPLAAFYHVPPAQVLVVCDEFALLFGQLRIKPRGSDGGHNGLKSVIARLGTQDFPRLRIGIGPVPPMFDPADFVLSNFAKADQDGVRDMVDRAADAVESFVKDGMERTMNAFN